MLALPAGEFLEECEHAWQNNTTPEFRQHLWHLNALLIDDVHLLANRPAALEEMYHAFNRLVADNRQLVLASRLAPNELTDFPVTLRTRFQSGLVVGKTAERHTSHEFVAFLEQIVRSQPATREIHIIADNLSAHKTTKVTDFLAAHPNVQMHYTPTYSSWLNQVELWFAKVKRDLLARGIFTSVTDLARKLRRFITKYNERAKPVRWAYADPARRIA